MRRPAEIMRSGQGGASGLDLSLITPVSVGPARMLVISSVRRKVRCLISNGQPSASASAVIWALSPAFLPIISHTLGGCSTMLSL